MFQIVLVPGAALDAAGRPTATFEQRLDMAAEIVKRFDPAFVIVAGKGLSSITEAQAGEEYLQTRIPQAMILKEQYSFETVGNFLIRLPRSFSHFALRE